MCNSGFRISTWSLGSKSAAVTSPAPYLLILKTDLKSLLVSLVFTTRFLILSTISTTSSATPLIVENSCWTPLILIPTGAAPGRADNKTLRKQLPIVIPKPLMVQLQILQNYHFHFLYR